LRVYLEYATLLPCLLPNLLYPKELLLPILLRSYPPLTHLVALTSIAIRGGIVGGRKPFHHHERWMQSKGGSCMKNSLCFQIFLIAQNFHECSTPVGLKPTWQLVGGYISILVCIFLGFSTKALIPYGRAFVYPRDKRNE